MTLFARTSDKPVLQQKLASESAGCCTGTESLNVESLDRECDCRSKSLFPREATTGLKFARLVSGSEE